MTPTFVNEKTRVSFWVDCQKYAVLAYFVRNSVKLAYKNSCLIRLLDVSGDMNLKRMVI